MSSLADDARFALRTFRRAPGFTATVVGTLAVGIAAITVVFAIVNAVLYERFDVYREPGRLVYVLESNAQLGANGGVSPRTLADWRAGARSFEGMAGVEISSTALVSAGAEAESVGRAAVTDGLLALLDARPAAGRLFTSAEYAGAPAPVALISHRLWQERFRGRPDVVGRAVKVGGQARTVVGVLAPPFTLSPFLGSNPDVYVPEVITSSTDRAARSLLVIGRLKPGAAGERAQAELDAISAAIAADDPAGKGWTPWLIQPHAFRMGGDAQFLVVLMVGVALVMTIVCANVANLLLARSSGRAREIATRLALGARRRRIARQLVTESVLLGGAGSLVGLFLSWSACRGVSAWIAGTSLGHLHLVLDRRVLVAASVVSLLTALGVGVIPALRLASLPVSEALKDAASLWGRLSAGRLRRLLAAAEVGMAVVLLLSAGLVLRGLANLRQNDPGFQPDHLLTLRVALPEARYGDAAQRTLFLERSLERLASRGSFRSVAAATLMPAIGGEAPVEAFEVEGHPVEAGRAPSAGVLSVSARYFETMKIPVLRGRGVDATDRAAGLPTAVVSRGLVAQWMPGVDPIGTRVQVDGVWRTIVGVAGDVRTFHLNVAPRPTIYLPYAQRPSQSFWLVLRTAGTGDQLALASEARREIGAIDAEQPVRGGDWATSLLKWSLGGFDLTALLVGVLAAVAVGLAALGIYGVIAFSVARQTREIGIRVAVGAGPREVIRQVMREALAIAVWGGLPGLLLGLGAGKLLSFRLERVSPFDPGLLALVVGLVTATVLAASWGPARRAARVDPVTATKTE